MNKNVNKIKYEMWKSTESQAWNFLILKFRGRSVNILMCNNVPTVWFRYEGLWKSLEIHVLNFKNLNGERYV